MSIRLLLLGLVATAVHAQLHPFLKTPANFLAIAWNNTLVVANQQNIPQGVAAVQPLIGVYNSSLCTANTTYFLLMTDPDVGGNVNTQNILHWMQSNLTCSASYNVTVNQNTIYPLNSTTPALAPYRGPMPPNNTTHRYTLVLFTQSAGYSVPSEFQYAVGPNAANTTNRRNFNVQNFTASLGYNNTVAGAQWNTTTANPNATTSAASTITGPVTTGVLSTALGGGSNPTSSPSASTYSGAAAQLGLTSKNLGDGLLGLLLSCFFML